MQYEYDMFWWLRQYHAELLTQGKKLYQINQCLYEYDMFIDLRFYPVVNPSDAFELLLLMLFCFAAPNSVVSYCDQLQ